MERRGVAALGGAPLGMGPGRRAAGGRGAGGGARGARGGAAPAPPGSLIPETLEDLRREARAGGGARKLSPGEERRERRRSLARLGVPEYRKFAEARGAAPLRRAAIPDILQLNIGLYCNQACRHCHVESSPLRTAEVMSRATAEQALRVLEASPSVRTVDLTGGAPELNPQFRFLVEGAAALGRTILDRCNLTVLLEPGQEDLPEFLAAKGVRVVASLPCYTGETVDKQRGGGVFGRSIEGLRRLNAAGFGRPGSGLGLDLVYNPAGAFLAPEQAKLEPAYKQELGDCYGVTFNNLLCLNNMPVKRFADQLYSEGKLEEYMQLLVENFNTSAADGVMCKSLLSVGWDGALYDCDFNQQLGMPLRKGGRPCSIFDLESVADLSGLNIASGSHCFGCSAGSGSSCSGATA